MTHLRSDLALLYHSDAYSFRNKVMGRQSAGIALLRAVAADAPKRLWCYCRGREDAAALEAELAKAGATETAVTWIPDGRPERLAEPGLLYRPDPMIASDAWRRQRAAGARAYSLCGITHTTASHEVMEGVAGLLTAPLEEWDAIICTSRAVRDSVRVIIEAAAEHLRQRVGATRLSLPQMPVIPLGVHCIDYASLGAERHPARARLGIAPKRIVVLFVGRLSFHGKAHPLPMYLGLEAAARHAPITLVQAGWFANEAIARAFEADARALCPSVEYRICDGRDPVALSQAWASADVFTSLSDNVQETFGLSPIEAMAAGLPVVGSDWDGYRDTVRDGIDGFLVPTMIPAPGHAGDLADRFDIGLDSYDRYCGYASQFTAVDVGAVSDAYTRLAVDPGLRTRMGEAGRQRAREVFDWPVIYRRYKALWDELGERRRSAPNLVAPAGIRRRPDRQDPFTVFARYPTMTISPTAQIRRRSVAREEILARRDLATVNFAVSLLPSPEVISAVLMNLPEDSWVTVSSLAERLSEPFSGKLARTLTWLAKVGALDFRVDPGPSVR